MARVSLSFPGEWNGQRFLGDGGVPDKLPKDLPLRAEELSPARIRLLGKPVRPSAAEVADNPRARSAILRIAEKLA